MKVTVYYTNEQNINGERIISERTWLGWQQDVSLRPQYMIKIRRVTKLVTNIETEIYPLVDAHTILVEYKIPPFDTVDYLSVQGGTIRGWARTGNVDPRIGDFNNITKLIDLNETRELKKEDLIENERPIQNVNQSVSNSSLINTSLTNGLKVYYKNQRNELANIVISEHTWSTYCKKMPKYIVEVINVTKMTNGVESEMPPKKMKASSTSQLNKIGNSTTNAITYQKRTENTERNELIQENTSSNASSNKFVDLTEGETDDQVSTSTKPSSEVSNEFLFIPDFLQFNASEVSSEVPFNFSQFEASEMLQFLQGDNSIFNTPVTVVPQSAPINSSCSVPPGNTAPNTSLPVSQQGNNNRTPQVSNFTNIVSSTSSTLYGSSNTSSNNERKRKEFTSSQSEKTDTLESTKKKKKQ